MSLFFFVSASIFIVTLALVIVQPRKMGIGYYSLIGAVISILLGITTLSDVVIVWNIVWNATFTLVSIIILSMVFDEAGFFEYLAIRIAKGNGSSGMRLFLSVIILGSLISAVFANDGTALILTPIVYSMLLRMNLKRRQILPFIMATGFIADAASLPLVVSNLVNIVAASYFSISFLAYALKMIVPDGVAIASSIFFLWLFYRKEIPGRISTTELPDPSSVIRDRKIFRVAPWIIVALIISYSIGGVFHVPVAFVAMPAAIIMVFIARRNSIVDTGYIMRRAPWQVVLFSLGMYIIVFGFGREGLTGMLASLIVAASNLPGPLSTILSGFIFASIAAIMNNMPSVMIGNLAIASIHSHGTLIYANIIGNDIGPKFTPIGSLATLLWLHTLERKHSLTISMRYYMKVGILVATPVLFLTLLSLVML